MCIFNKRKSKADKIVDRIISRGTYFPATLSGNFGTVHLQVLHADAEKYQRLMEELGVVDKPWVE